MEKRSEFKDFAEFTLALEDDLVADGNYSFPGLKITIKGEFVYFTPDSEELMELLATLAGGLENQTIH